MLSWSVKSTNGDNPLLLLLHIASEWGMQSEPIEVSSTTEFYVCLKTKAEASIVLCSVVKHAQKKSGGKYDTTRGPVFFPPLTSLGALQHDQSTSETSLFVLW